MTAVEVILLEGFPDKELAALNLAIQLYGCVPKSNIAHKRAVELKLVQITGYAWDVESLRDAAAFEVNRRVVNGTWGNALK